MAFATDVSGLLLIRRAFRCYELKDDAIRHCELGMSNWLLRGGYNIGCFISLYDGVDFRSQILPVNDDPRWVNPAMGFYGRDLQPMEIMFVKLAGNVRTHHDRHGGYEIDSTVRTRVVA